MRKKLTVSVWSTCCSARAEKFSRKSLNYACLRRVIDDGGLFPAWVIRMSALPTHATTVLFAVCGFPVSLSCSPAPTLSFLSLMSRHRS